ncbi:reverse transcriptase domain-containing protein [Sphingomonas arantia]|uniref:Reverse transcriptase domain-containing protein n=1 Tax=Sphingomonas arantia TaxID=1460676 RepID=A0ABW4TWM4_9SPHN
MSSQPSWFRQRGYLHLDMPVKVAYAASLNAASVAAHTWSPLIHYVKSEKRYKVDEHKTVAKQRSIMFASHRDACVLSKYSADLVKRLDQWYIANDLNETVIAYRSLGQSNYHFAKRVEDFVRQQSALTVMCFDVTGFFDNLDHRRLKSRLKWIIGDEELSSDWFAVLRAVTRYRYIDLVDIKKHDELAKRLKERKHHPLATIVDLKKLGVPIHKNLNAIGIPQGTPISASLSNLYLTEFDQEVAAEAVKHNALYQRYSDDILIACCPSLANMFRSMFRSMVRDKLNEHGLTLQDKKTEIVTLCNSENGSTFQYLGYQLGHVEARIRLKSLSRQWRTAKRAVKKTERVGLAAMKSGKAKQIYTRKLRMRFTTTGARNFLAYAEKSAVTLDSAALRGQARKLHKFMNREITRLRGPSKPKKD